MATERITLLIAFSAVAQITQQAAVMPKPDGKLHVYGLPVGQGDGTVIQCPNGDLTIVDLGSSTRTQNEGQYMTDDELINFFGPYINQLKYVFITHADQDHFNLFPQLKPATKINSAFLGCKSTNYPPVLTNWIKDYVQSTFDSVSVGKKVTICPSVSIVVLASNTDIMSPDDCTNGDSLVLRLEYYNFKLLLPGDVEDYSGFTYDDNGYITSNIIGWYGKPGILRTIINNWSSKGGIASHVYRLAHHGTWPNGNKKFFIQAIQPQYVFSSSKLPGTPGTYNHPNCLLYDAMIDMAKNKQIPLKLTVPGVNQQKEYFCGLNGDRYKEDDNQYGVYTTAAINNNTKLVNYYVKVDSDGSINNFSVAPLKWR